MTEEKSREPSTEQTRENRRAETDRAFAEIKEKERKERLEKTMRLRRMRLVKE
ncbi:hypothetical protein IHQ71_31090 (plasmid) [Rhizobium sp. TH2]|uniref:hypothetical protein n=1 Tax=Rhizobium sp. TH2 TaxID=2775403 RepID=UPI0021570980|nr:hypothetical protein [Rhizobium sp. TH2]UVC12443.1 hypothetical protein IHQ71_31090 [Rhizobium sp. TH2]